ncbi:MAG TPA: adenylate/guanylate cyclase domain-containing protein [Chloroflexota bacterium]|nr:adenylate/guanylate cyclase domain-containing protein [Chloroflexota bacterium]
MTGQAAGRATRFRHLLYDYNERPDERERIVGIIQQEFCTTLAVLVIDTCGFTRQTHALGIIPFLARQELLERLIGPVVAQHGGRLLCTEADNFFAVFPDAAAAVSCAAETMGHVAAANEALPAADETRISIGIGYGSVLDLGDGHLYGDEMNFAFKLGEDLAAAGETLLTPAAHAALGETGWRFEERSYDIAGLHLTAYRLLA